MTENELLDYLQFEVDYSGTIGDVLAKLRDDVLQAFHDGIGNIAIPTFLYFGMRRAAVENGNPNSLTVTIERVERTGRMSPTQAHSLVSIATRLLMIEWMRRQGFLNVEYPEHAFTEAAQRDPHFEMTVTDKGRARQAALERQAAGIGNGGQN